MNQKTRYTISGVTVLENIVDDNNLALVTLKGLGWKFGPVGGDHEHSVLLMFLLKDAATLGTIYANPRFVVRASSPTNDFIRQARRAQRSWLRDMKVILGSSGRLRQAISQRQPMQRQLELTGVLVVNGKHVAPSEWPSTKEFAQLPEDLTGQVFGRLKVLARAGSGRWLCQCQCENTTIVRTKHLVRNKIRSCGCLKAEYEARQQLRKSLHS